MNLPWIFRKGSARNKAWISITWIILLTALIGAIEFGEPLEDLYRGGRNMLHQRSADGRVVVVAMDERSVIKFGSERFPLVNDAQLLDQLFSLGARRVYFDRTFASSMERKRAEKGNKAFVSALKRYEGKVFLGGLTAMEQGGRKEDVLPDPLFRNASKVVSLNGYMTPFSLSAELAYGSVFDGRFRPSISASIARVDHSKTDYYRPDWSILASTVPTFSYVDVMVGHCPPGALAGKDVIIGPTSLRYHDIRYIVGQGWIPGVYFHAIGAQTLSEGTPSNWGWLPAYGIAMLMSLAILNARTRKTAALVNVGALLAGLAVPFLTDRLFITADYIPAYLLFALISYRTNSIRELAASQQHHEGTNLPKLSVLQESCKQTDSLVIAMRIRNYAAICAGFQKYIGHELVTELARRMQLASAGAVYHHSEDVLYTLSPELSRDDLEEHLKGLAQLLETQLLITGRMVDVRLSFGVDGDKGALLENRIAKALYAADSAASENKLWEMYRLSPDDWDTIKLSLMSELDMAMERNQLWVAYQPQVDVQTGKVVGAEALARWNHPEYGAIPPDEFIQVAETYNRVFRLTMYILEQATQGCLGIVAQDPFFRLSVNLSATLLEDPTLPTHIRRLLEKTGFPSQNLTIEITETASFSAREIASAGLRDLQTMGIRISIDDYGTGNATLDYLKSMPWDEVKLDRQFVSNITSSSADRYMVESTIELAHRMSRVVVAEGIEDQATLSALRELKCDVAQGYYFARPLTMDCFLGFIAANDQQCATGIQIGAA